MPDCSRLFPTVSDCFRLFPTVSDCHQLTAHQLTAQMANRPDI